MSIQRTAPFFLLTLAALAAGCAPQEAAVDDAALANADPISGEALYMDLCASCHGADGMGTASGSSLLGISESNDQALWDVIFFGEDGMPAYSDLSDQEIADLIAWMRAAYS